MATIIIQGNFEESDKVVNALKNQFNVLNKKAIIPGVSENMTILDVYSEKFGKDGFSHFEIEKALRCCSDAERKCDSCPYRKESDCSEKVLLDGAKLISVLFSGGFNEKA